MKQDFFKQLVLISLVGISALLLMTNPASVQAQYECGTTYPTQTDRETLEEACQCSTGVSVLNNNRYCCGATNGYNCTDPNEAEEDDPIEDPDESPDETEEDDEIEGLDVYEGPTSEFFSKLNPLTSTEDEFEGNDPNVGERLTTPGGVMSRLLQFALPIAGMILFVMLLWGGFEILAGATDKQSMEAGRQRITAAIIGFVLLFASYWIIQIIEVIFGVAIL